MQCFLAEKCFQGQFETGIVQRDDGCLLELTQCGQLFERQFIGIRQIIPDFAQGA